MFKRSALAVPALLAALFVTGSTSHARADDAEAPHGDSAQEKKAVKESMATIAKALASAKSACGNKKLTVEVDWKAYDKFVEKFAKDSDRTKPNIYGLTGDLVSEGLDSLKESCSDADYKKAAATLTTWKATPKYVKDTSSSKAQTFKRTGSTMTVTFHPGTSTGGGSLDLVRAAL